MHLRSDPDHPAAKAGNVLRASEDGVNVFISWGDVEAILESGGRVPGQFSEADFISDFEVYIGRHPTPLIHMERSFSTAAKALVWFAFLSLLVQRTPPRIFRETALLTRGRLT